MAQMIDESHMEFHEFAVPWMRHLPIGILKRTPLTGFRKPLGSFRIEPSALGAGGARRNYDSIERIEHEKGPKNHGRLHGFGRHPPRRFNLLV